MNQPYFIVEFAHSIHGQFKRIYLSHRVLKYLFFSFFLVGLFILGLASTCVWMSWKVTKYERMRADLDHLRTRYQELQRVANQRKQQMASLESLAGEVSAAYGLHPPSTLGDESVLSSSSHVRESIQEFNFLKAATYSGIYHRYAYQWQEHAQPNAWPLTGIIRSAFGERQDPFSGEGAFHTGIDLSAVSGTPVHATADGVVISAGWSTGYGKLVIIQHGNGVETYYGHLSEFLVVPGQEVRLGQVIARSGGTGRSTSPHLHYEVRVAGIPVNPYRYLPKTQVADEPRTLSHNDLGL